MRIAPIPTLAALLVCVTTLSLGHWQTRRAQEKQQLQNQRDAATAAAPVELTASTDPRSLDALFGRRVSVSGEWVAARTVFLDNRTHQRISGAHVLTPMRIADSDRWVMVLRGWTATDPSNRNRAPQLVTPAQTVRIEGLVEPDLAQALSLGTEPEPGPDDVLWQRFSLAKYRQWSNHDVLPLVIRQTSELPDRLVRDWPVPGRDVDKHRAYAFQWYAMAALSALGWLGFTLRRRTG